MNDDGALIEIELNGARTPLPAGLSVAGLIERLGYGQRRIAVEIDGTIVPRSRHAERILKPGERVEIVHALGGG